MVVLYILVVIITTIAPFSVEAVNSYYHNYGI